MKKFTLLLFGSLLFIGCATSILPQEPGDNALRIYRVPVEMTAPDTLAAGATNYQ